MTAIAQPAAVCRVLCQHPLLQRRRSMRGASIFLNGFTARPGTRVGRTAVFYTPNSGWRRPEGLGPRRTPSGSNDSVSFCCNFVAAGLISPLPPFVGFLVDHDQFFLHSPQGKTPNSMVPAGAPFDPFSPVPFYPFHCCAFLSDPFAFQSFHVWRRYKI